MKPTLFLCFSFAAFIFISFKTNTNPFELNGHLKTKNKETTSLNGITVLFKADNQVVANSITDKDGSFNINFTPKDERLFEVCFINKSMDTIPLYSTTELESDNIELTFYIP